MERFTMTKTTKTTKKATVNEEIIESVGSMEAKAELEQERVKSAIEILLESAINKIIAIDCGKNNMKAIYNNDAYIYSNKINFKHGDSLNGFTWNVTYQGSKYYVGDSADESDLGEGKASLEHRVQALTVIANYLDPNEKNDDIVLVYGESVDYYFDVDNREAIIKTLEGKHEIAIEKDGEEVVYKFTIKKVHVLPEGIGYIINNISNCVKGRNFIVDIGGRTINFLTVNNGAPSEKESFSNEMGVYDIASKCQQTLKKAKFGNISIANIESYIRFGAKNPEVQAVINKTVIEHFKEFDKILRKRGIDIHQLIKTDNVIFVGGGTQAFKEQIREHYGTGVEIPEKPILTNVTGYYLYGLQKFGKMEF